LTLEISLFAPAVQLQVERLRIGTFLLNAVNIVTGGKPGVGKSHLWRRSATS
jgi:hypothetical protein